MKMTLKIIAAVLFAAFIAIQFVRPDFTNPPLVAGQTLEESVSVPENVQTILKRSCKDCHSNETVYPWYSKIQPAAWFLKDHIDDGRKEMNFSVWTTYSPKRQKRKLEEMCEEIKSQEMPLPSYLWIHWNAELSADEIKAICDWTQTEGAKIAE